MKMNQRLDQLATEMASQVTRRDALVRGAGIVGGMILGVFGLGTRKAEALPYATCLQQCTRAFPNLVQRQRCIQACETGICSSAGSCESYGPCSNRPANPNCLCGESTEGVGKCFTAVSCDGLLNCTASAQCPAGYFCLVNSCCDVEVGVCAPQC